MPAIKGVKGYRIGIIDEATGLLEKNTTLGPNGIYDGRGTNAKGMVSANISGLAPATTEVYGNDVVQFIATGVAQPKIAITINDLPNDVKAAVLGQASNGLGGYYDAGDRIPYIALDIISEDLAGNELHFSFFKGQLTPGNADISTNNNSPKIVADALTFSAVSNKDGHLYAITTSGSKEFDIDKLNALVFPTSNDGSGNGSNVPTETTATISIHYEDETGASIDTLPNSQVKGTVGNSYTIPTPEVAGYTYNKTSLPLNGTFTGDQTATVTYTKN